MRSIRRLDILFWVAAAAIILAAVAVASSRPPAHNVALYWLLLIGGLVVFRLGAQMIWASMRQKREHIWIGVGVSIVGLLLAAVGLCCV